MPELPEVETTRQGISPHIKGRRVRHVMIRQYQLRWPIDPQLPASLYNRKLLDITRRGKYLLLQFTHGCLFIHLGMSGSLRIVTDTDEALKKHDHVEFLFAGNIGLRFHDPRRFGSMVWTTDPPDTHKLLCKLGPEPLSECFSAEYLFTVSRRRKKEVKTLIMDSHIVVGVGNIYANESLFLAGICPTTTAETLTKQQCQSWVPHIKTILQRSIAQGGTTLRDFVDGNGNPGYFAQQLNVYGRGGQPCVRCKKPLLEIRQAQRATVYCARCQQ